METASVLPVWWYARPGTAAHTLTLPDFTPVTLDCMWVDRVIGNYVFIRDPWPGWRLLPVYTDAQLGKYQTVEVRGYTQTVAGTRVVVAQQVRLYLDSRGGDMPLFPPKGRHEPEEWPFMWAVPSTPVSPGESIPAPPDPNSNIEPSAPTVPPEGSIAAAKMGVSAAEGVGARTMSALSVLSALSTPMQEQEGSVALTGKVVTAVFYEGQTVSYFYIQEQTTGGNGIKVVPQIPVPVEPGNIVTVKGMVVASGASVAECYIDASSVGCTGSMVPPKPVGTCGRSTATAMFGCQQKLYLQTAHSPRTAVDGAGLSLVGTRVRVWGKVTCASEGSTGTTYFLDDGSGLKSNNTSGEQAGLRVIVAAGSTSTYALNAYVDGITGVCGAEMSDAQPVPVVRVPRQRSEECSIVRVKTDGDDSHYGTNWTDDAMLTIQNALYRAGECGEVWVKAGTYPETITLANGVALYGGFAGTETLREQRDWVNNETEIDADGLYDAGVYDEYLSSPATRIDGFRITNGAGKLIYGVRYGGGVCSEGSAVIANNLITANTAESGGGVASWWGNATIWSNSIVGNTAGCGTGIGVGCCKPTICNNTIAQNTNASTGVGNGAIRCEDDYAWRQSATIANNDIRENTGAEYGGGVYCVRCAPSITGNTFTGNTASVEGGGIMCDGASGTIARNTFDSNSGVDHGGGIAMHDSAGVKIVNNVFVHNHCGGMEGLGGGAIHARDSGPTVVNNTFVENYVGTGTWPDNFTPAAYGGAIHVRGWPGTKIINNVFLNNRAATGDSQSNSVAFTESGTGSVTYCDAFSSAGFTYDNTDHADSAYHYYGVTPGTCVIPGVDPELCDVTGGSLWLRTTSPLHVQYHGQSNANDSDVPQDDIEGYSRPGLDAYTDMGAYESDHYNCP